MVSFASDPIKILVARRSHETRHTLMDTILIQRLCAENTCRQIGCAIWVRKHGPSPENVHLRLVAVLRHSRHLQLMLHVQCVCFRAEQVWILKLTDRAPCSLQQIFVAWGGFRRRWVAFVSLEFDASTVVLVAAVVGGAAGWLICAVLIGAQRRLGSVPSLRWAACPSWCQVVGGFWSAGIAAFVVLLARRWWLLLSPACFRLGSKHL